MGNTASTIGDSIQACTDRVGIVWVTILLALFYLVLWACSVAAIAVQIANDGKSGAATFSLIMGFLSPLAHLAIVLTGVSFIEGYIQYPVPPRMLFFGVDLAHFLALGMTIGGAAANPSLAMAANFVLVLAQSAVQYRSYVLVRDVWAGRRDGRTGELYEPTEEAEEYVVEYEEE